MALSMFLIAMPTLAFLFLLLWGSSLSKAKVSFIGILGVGLSALLSGVLFFQSFSKTHAREILWSLLPTMGENFASIDVALYLDPLSMVMAMVVTFVSLWIALYSAEYMVKEIGLCRFFAVVNLFVAFMLLLVLADNLVLLYMGFEGVGICSYLLIGFYFQEKEAQKASMKAFLTTRIGDIFLLFALFLAIFIFGTTSMTEIGAKASRLDPDVSVWITAMALCLLGGAVGKSAQFPLQTWLPDAMWGPTPVSALIHAATMVTAGVYLIARLSPVFLLSSIAHHAVLIIGTITLILGGISALVQTDLKRVLAYSTMSQIGYMFLALGVNAPDAAIFHLTTHAFFKALLFLCAGAIGHAIHSYQMDKMGGLFRKMPLLCFLFLIGCASLMGIPFVSAGFFSKEWILSQALATPETFWAYGAGCFGVFLTSVYTTRMVLLVLFGPSNSAIKSHSGPIILIPLVALAIFSTCIGWLQLPEALGHLSLVSHYLKGALPTSAPLYHGNAFALFLPSGFTLLGICVAWYFCRGFGHKTKSTSDSSILIILKDGGGFNLLYLALFVRPYIWLSEKLGRDVIESGLMELKEAFSLILSGLDICHKKSLIHHISFLVVAGIAIASLMVFL